MSALFFFLGFLSTMQIFKYKMFSIYFYPFDLVYYGLIFILAVKLILDSKSNLKLFSENEKMVLVIFLVYSLFSVNLFTPIFDNANLDYLLVSVKLFIKKLIFLIFFFLIYYSKKNIRKSFVKYFILGFFISVIFHSLYSYCTSYYWYFRGLDIHTYWLNSIGITVQSVGHDLINFIYYPILRSTGFHWDPAYFGLWGVIGIFYILLKPYKFLTKLLLSLIIFVPWMLTFSRSAVFGLLVVFIILLIIMIKTKKSICHIFNSKNFISVLIATLLILSVMMFMSFTDRLSAKDILKSRLLIKEDIHTQKHIQYPLMAGKALLKDPYHFIFGYGNRNSGRAVEEYVIAIQENYKNFKAHDIESDISRIPINTGILGFSAYLLFISVILFQLMQAYFKTKNEFHLFIFIAICTTFFAGFFYAYSDSVWVWMFYIIAVILLQNDKNDKVFLLGKNE